MGVTGLWSILSELCNREPLMYLSGKRVAIDLSGWVVQATMCKSLSASKNPHLRNLFFRVSSLLQTGVCPVFVIEGKPPALKEVTFKKRNYAEHRDTKSGISRSNFDRILKQCQDLLDCLGVPCIKSSGEAEALCAFLYLNGIVDGVITEDNDAFLYGADVIFRDYTIDPKDAHVNVYNLQSDKNRLHLDRKKLVALSLLLGCDYSNGVPGVGKEAVLKFLLELNGADILQRFQDWKTLDETELFPGYLGKKVKKLSHCNRCDHLGSSSVHKKNGCEACNSTITCYLNSDATCTCPWHINNQISLKQKAELKIYNAVKEISDFPNSEVINEYLNYSDQIPDSEALLWKCPNLHIFQEKAFNYLGWTVENSLGKCLPLITSWQLYSLRHNIVSNQMLFEPVKIIKEKIVRGEDCLEILWQFKDAENNTDLPFENLCTVEYLKLFSPAYPDITKSFFEDKIKEKEAKTKAKVERLEKRKRTMKEAKDSRKVMQRTPLVPSIILKTNIINSSSLRPNSPSSKSFDSFTNVPLSVRVIALSEKMSQKHIKEIKMTNEVAENSGKIHVGSSKMEQKNLQITRNDFSKSRDSFSKITPQNCIIADSFQNNFCLQFNDSDDSFNIILNQNKELFPSRSKRNLSSDQKCNDVPDKMLPGMITNLKFRDSENISSKFDSETEQNLLSEPGSLSFKPYKRQTNVDDGSSLCLSHDDQVINDENHDLNSQCIKNDFLTLAVNDTEAFNEESKNEEIFFQCSRTNDSSIDNLMLQVHESCLIEKPSSILVNNGSLHMNNFSPEISDLEFRITEMQIRNNCLAANNLKPYDESCVSPEVLYVLNQSNLFCKTPRSFISSTPNIRLERWKSRNISTCFERSKLFDTTKLALYSPVIFDSRSDSSLNKEV